MNKIVTFSIAMLIGLSACKQNKQATTMGNKVVLTNATDSASYALAVLYAQGMKQQGISDLNYELFGKALADMLSGKVSDSAYIIDKNKANAVMQQFMNTKKEREGIANMQAGQKFLEENKKQSGVVTLPSGLQYKVIKEGSGKKPGPTDNVTVHYTGKLIDGRVFDSSVDRGEPISFALNGVIKGWTEGLQLMSEGSKYMLYIPSNLAYGVAAPQGSIIGSNAALIFEVELLSIGSGN